MWQSVLAIIETYIPVQGLEVVPLSADVEVPLTLKWKYQPQPQIEYSYFNDQFTWKG